MAKSKHEDDIRRAMEEYTRKGDELFSQRPYPKNVIRYTHNATNYYIVQRYDFGSYLQEESKLTKPDKDRLVDIENPGEAISFILSGILDDDEGITSPDGLDLGKEFSALLKQNGIEGLERKLMRYAYRLLTKETKDPMKELDPKTADVCNKMLENFSHVRVGLDMPEKIISEQKLIVTA